MLAFDQDAREPCEERFVRLRDHDRCIDLKRAQGLCSIQKSPTEAASSRCTFSANTRLQNAKGGKPLQNLYSERLECWTSLATETGRPQR